MKDPLIDQTENEKESRGTPKHDAERNKLISENYLQTTLHFQKRIQKLFTLMQHDDFFGKEGGKNIIWQTISIV